jgi:hypothetical protein
MSSSSEQALKEIIDAIIEKTTQQIGIEKFDNKKIEWDWIEGYNMPTYGMDKKEDRYIIYINKEVIAVEGGEIPWGEIRDTRIKNLEPIKGPLGGPRDTVEFILQRLSDDLKEMLEQLAEQIALSKRPDVVPIMESNIFPEGWNKRKEYKVRVGVGGSYQGIDTERGNVIVSPHLSYKDSFYFHIERIVERWRIDYEDLSKLLHLCQEAAQEIINAENERLKARSKDIDNTIDDADINLNSIKDEIVRRVNRIIDEF